MSQALFITFEGGDGSGKSTATEVLAHHISAKGQEVVTTRDPGGTRISNKIRYILLDKGNTNMTPTTELLLYQASRAQLTSEVTTPALAAGKTVICDRFLDSTRVYQGCGRGWDKETLQYFEQLVVKDRGPDITFLLDIAPCVGLKRSLNRNAKTSGPDETRFEQEPEEFHTQIRQGFLDLAEKESHRFIVIPTESPIEQVWKQIITKYEEKIKELEEVPS